MPGTVDTCPQCGALITPNLARCRQCKTYLRGSRLEGFLVESLLPKSWAAAPGTGLLITGILAYYLLMVVLGGIQSLASFSRYSLIQLGALSGSFIELGQWWRVVTSMWAHHDLVHLAFNASALSAVGPMVEGLFDKKKMLILYLLTGALSMGISHIWMMHVGHAQPGAVSAGASGALCGLIGAALVAAKRGGESLLYSQMLRWAVILGLIGLVLPVNNAAHLGGFATGAAAAAWAPLGPVASRAGHRVAAGGLALLIALQLAATGMMLAHFRGYPGRLEDDADPRHLFIFTIDKGKPWDRSTQYRLLQSCRAAATASPPAEDLGRKCEFALRASPGHPVALAGMQIHYAQTGREDEAQILARILRSMPDRGR